ncbi:hypothetical protein [Rhodococcus jostii]|nr:hypothetical protein [Rhodococcus jostii]
MNGEPDILGLWAGDFVQHRMDADWAVGVTAATAHGPDHHPD